MAGFSFRVLSWRSYTLSMIQKHLPWVVLGLFVLAALIGHYMTATQHAASPATDRSFVPYQTLLYINAPTDATVLADMEQWITADGLTIADNGLKYHATYFYLSGDATHIEKTFSIQIPAPTETQLKCASSVDLQPQNVPAEFAKYVVKLTVFYSGTKSRDCGDLIPSSPSP